MRPVDFRAAKKETDWYKSQQSQAMITTYLNVLHYFPPRNIKQAKLGEAKKNVCYFYSVIFGLSFCAAVNYGLVSISMMLLSMADHQV